MTSSPHTIDIENASKNFGKITAVDRLNLVIDPGEVVAFLGPNGAGKTTTVDMILGLSEPTSGTVKVFGDGPRSAIALGRVAAVMQTGGLLKDFTVRETVELTASLFRPVRPVEEVLERAGIIGIANRLVGKASGGEQQRLRFALALLADPDLLILDEPTTGIDVQGRREFWSAIRDDAQRGRTVLFATHYLEEADAYADRIVLLRHGRVVADGSAAHIKSLASGRTIRATIDGVQESDRAAIEQLNCVDAVELRGHFVLIHGSDSDAIARYLFDNTTARDLEITSRNLEDAFVALTADSPELVENRLQGANR